jgi:flagellar M-ring protein FliF
VERIAARWNRTTPQQRLLTGALALAALIAIGVALALRRDTTAALFAEPLQADQVGAVADTLAAWNVPYVAGADNVRVDAAHRSDILLRLSIAGIPHAHLTTRSEALAKASALTPQAVIDAEGADGLGNDIAAALRGVAGVREARVIIAPAKPAMFGDETAHDASASVRLTMEPGTVLDTRVADGLRAFVAASVPGLDAKRVALLDDRASPVAAQSVAADDASSAQASLQSVLDAALGAGTAIVRVHAEYDALSHEVRDVKRAPLPGAAIARTTLDERYSNERKRYTKTNDAEDRGSDVREERTDVPAGRLARLSVAVAVDRAKHADLATLRSLAAATVGIDAARGDTIDVEEVDFPSSGPARTNALDAALPALAAVVPALAGALVLIVGLNTVGKPLIALCESGLARARAGHTRRAVEGYAPAQVRGALRGEPPHTAAAIISALPAATATAVLELYPPEERAAIVRRMARAASPIVPDVESVLHRA